MKVRCRKFEFEDTEREVEAEDPEHAPDEYVKTYFALEPGDVVFVETWAEEGGAGYGWRLWRVECHATIRFGSGAAGRVFSTESITADDAHREWAENQPS